MYVCVCVCVKFILLDQFFLIFKNHVFYYVIMFLLCSLAVFFCYFLT